MLGYLSVSIIPRTLTWATGSLTCVCVFCFCFCMQGIPRFIAFFFNIALRPRGPCGWPTRLSHTSPHTSSTLLYVRRDRMDGHLDFHTPPHTSSTLLYVRRDRMDGHLDFHTPPHTSSTLLYVHRDRTDYYGRGAQDIHPDFHTAAELHGL